MPKGGTYMNRSGIEWCDHTWNPVTGCRHGCPYCYARKMTARFSGDVRINMMAERDYSMVPAADGGGDLYVLDAPMVNETGSILAYPFGFEPTFHRYRMGIPEKLKMGKNIFVGAMSDMFGEWVPDAWLDEVFETCKEYPVHNYLFLTKNVRRYCEYGVPTAGNMWYGTSITRESEADRFNFLPAGCRTFVSIEPLLEDIDPGNHNIMFRQADWIIIGAETGRKTEKVVPEAGWVRDIVREADAAGIPVFMKESLVPVVGEQDMRRDFPGQLQGSELSPGLRKKLFGVCVECGADRKKSDMVALLARERRGEQPRQFCYMCRECLGVFCGRHGIEMPFGQKERGGSEDEDRQG